MTTQMQITSVDIRPVALPMRGALHHSDGEIPPWQVRYLLEVHTDADLVGLGEASPRISLGSLEGLTRSVVGADPFNLELLHLRTGSEKFYRMDVASAAAALEMACLDIQGKAVGRPVVDVLGGRVNTRIPVIAYLFRKTGVDGHPDVADGSGLVSDAQRLVDAFGFQTLKYKAGAVSPHDDLAAAALLRAKFPDHRLRIDPNGAWSTATAIQLAGDLARLDLEWVEDPCIGLESMSEFTRRIAIATATNMCCIQPGDIPATVTQRAVNVVLHDPWYIGGPRRARQMAATCRTFGLGVGIHAGGGSAETGVGLAAQAHLAASLPGFVHAMDTMHHELADDVTTVARWPYDDGTLTVPDTPGLGVELDTDKVEKYAKTYRALVAGELPHSEPAESYPAYPQY